MAIIIQVSVLLVMARGCLESGTGMPISVTLHYKHLFLLPVLLEVEVDFQILDVAALFGWRITRRHACQRTSSLSDAMGVPLMSLSAKAMCGRQVIRAMLSCKMPQSPLAAVRCPPDAYPALLVTSRTRAGPSTIRRAIISKMSEIQN